MKKTYIIIFAILLSFVMVNDARADFFDKLGSFVDDVNEKVSDLDLDKLEKDIDKYAGDITKNSEKAKKALKKYADKDDDSFLSRAAKEINRGIDKVDGATKKINKTYKDNSGRINETVEQVKELGGRISTTAPTTIRTPGIVMDESGAFGNKPVIADVPIVTEKKGMLDKIKGSVGETVNGLKERLQEVGITSKEPKIGITYPDPPVLSTPEPYTGKDLVKGRMPGFMTNVSIKAIEAMAALGDPWAKIKLEEMNARRFMENEKTGYEETSWFNLFTKIDRFIDYRNAKKFYEDANDRRREFEKNNPGSNGIDNGISQINESILEFKALFGDETAKMKLELNKAQKELDEMEYKYRKAGFFKKFSLRDDLKMAQKRVENAEIRIKQSFGYAPNGNSNIKQMDYESEGGGVLDFFKKRKQKNSAAYQRYIHYLNQPNPDPAELKRLKDLID